MELTNELDRETLKPRGLSGAVSLLGSFLIFLWLPRAIRAFKPTNQTSASSLSLHICRNHRIWERDLINIYANDYHMKCLSAERCMVDMYYENNHQLIEFMHGLLIIREQPETHQIQGSVIIYERKWLVFLLWPRISLKDCLQREAKSIMPVKYHGCCWQTVNDSKVNEIRSEVLERISLDQIIK